MVVMSIPYGDPSAGAGEPAADLDPEQIRIEIAKATEELHALQGEEPLVQIQVDGAGVAQVVGAWTGIPVGKMVGDELSKVLSFEDELRERVVGQDPAIASIAKKIRAAKAGLQLPTQPIGVFLLVGPSGVGKTETGLGVADLLFGGERFMTTINMSEFMEKHTVSRLIGSPPGYVGYGEGGVLTEGVRHRPYSVVLLDEIEKADPEVMNLFYQVFDKGTLSDGEGREVDFKNTVLMMTSNLGSDIIMEACQSDEPPNEEQLLELIRPTLQQYLKPALLGRMTVLPYFPGIGNSSCVPTRRPSMVVMSIPYGDPSAGRFQAARGARAQLRWRSVPTDPVADGLGCRWAFGTSGASS